MGKGCRKNGTFPQSAGLCDRFERVQRKVIARLSLPPGGDWKVERERKMIKCRARMSLGWQWTPGSANLLMRNLNGASNLFDIADDPNPVKKSYFCGLFRNNKTNNSFTF